MHPGEIAPSASPPASVGPASFSPVPPAPPAPAAPAPPDESWTPLGPSWPSTLCPPSSVACEPPLAPSSVSGLPAPPSKWRPPTEPTISPEPQWVTLITSKGPSQGCRGSGIDSPDDAETRTPLGKNLQEPDNPK